MLNSNQICTKLKLNLKAAKQFFGWEITNLAAKLWLLRNYARILK